MPQDMRTYWMFQDDMVVINVNIMKGRCVVIPEAFKTQAQDQLHGSRKVQAPGMQIGLLG